MDFSQIFRARQSQEKQSADEKARAKELAKTTIVPNIVLFVANVFVLSLDYRVVEAMWNITKNPALAVFAIFVSGAAFILWFDVLYRYLMSNETQQRISLWFSGISLVTAGVFAFFDYGVSVDVGKGMKIEVPTNANTLFALMVILTIAHVVGLFAWYLNDEQIDRKTKVAKQLAKSDEDKRKQESAKTLLADARVILYEWEAMRREFGDAAVKDVMQLLAGVEISMNKDIDGNGTVGTVGTSAPMLVNASTVQGQELKETGANFQTPPTK